MLSAGGPDSQLLGLDLDPQALQIARQTLAPFGERVVIRQASHVTLQKQLASLGWGSVDGILLDLGASSMQFDTPTRGFSFLKEGPLDMRFDPSSELQADEIVNTWDEQELAAIILEYGEERAARRIARAICAARPLHSTLALAAAIEKVQPRQGAHHPATRTFQALRMAVNGELEALAQTLPQAIQSLKPGGRLAVISFHSLEDRLVKNTFRQESRDCLCPPRQPVCTCGHTALITEVNRRVITPSETEIRNNPRARSAKLRIAARK
jgi:16S rRNA (cytosine1402-N4)-methyltransferase